RRTFRADTRAPPPRHSGRYANPRWRPGVEYRHTPSPPSQSADRSQAEEYALLEFLMRNARRPVTRTMIIEHVWDIHFDSISNVVDVQINSLRNKIDKGRDVALLRTIRGVGYMISDQ